MQPRTASCRQLHALLLFLLLLLPSVAAAWDGKGSRRSETGQCPNEAEANMVYSPFKPYWKWDEFKGNAQNCWAAADCLFGTAGESRKQQFAATALVMGLIPLTIKDIAWPERRLIFVTERLHWAIEILVLALGLVPMETKNQKTTRLNGCEGTLLAKIGWSMRKTTVKCWILTCTLAVLACYSGLTNMEVYSKRSALGCPAPITITAWHIVALIPATVHSLFAHFRRHRFQRRVRIHGTSLRPRPEQDGRLLHDVELFPLPERPKLLHRAPGQHLDINDEDDELDAGNDRETKMVSAVQGADEEWPVQLAWGVYYIAGTLVFTSIMAVTVVELVVWVALGLATAGFSKVLAFFLCLVFEETGVPESHASSSGSGSRRFGGDGAGEGVGNDVGRGNGT